MCIVGNQKASRNASSQSEKRGEFIPLFFFFSFFGFIPDVIYHYHVWYESKLISKGIGNSIILRRIKEERTSET